VRRRYFIALLVLGAEALSAGEPAFTTRVSLDSPVTVSSFTESKVYGFESVLIENEGQDAVSAVQLVVTFRTASGDQVADERRFAVEIAPRTSKRIIVDLGHKEGLRQKMKPGPESQALAILTVKAAEFAGGRLWKADAPLTLDPLIPPRIEKK